MTIGNDLRAPDFMAKCTTTCLGCSCEANAESWQHIKASTPIKAQTVDNLLLLFQNGFTVEEAASRCYKGTIPNGKMRHADGTETHVARQLRRYKVFVDEVQRIYEMWAEGE